MLQKYKNTRPGFVPLTIICLILIMSIGRVLWISSFHDGLTFDVLNHASRMINGTFTAVITFMALIITLASNLYTPGLVKLFVRHPVIIVGISYIIICNLMTILANLFGPTHPYFEHILELTYILSCFALASTIPFLYYISQFLRPSYFLPLLVGLFKKNLFNLENKVDVDKSYIKAFETIDTISNIALTASKRDDRQLMGLVCIMLQECFDALLKDSSTCKSQWRQLYSKFIPGHSDEAKDFLRSEYCWPEAYIFGKVIHILKGATKDQDEVINQACEGLLKSMKRANLQQNKIIVEMHVMMFNRLAEISIEQNLYERIQSLSQYFRDMIKTLKNDPQMMSMTFSSWVHFANLAYERNIHFAYETFLYDSGRLILDFAETDSEEAYNLFINQTIPFWNMAISDGGKHKDVTYRVAVKTYWQSRLHGYDKISKEIEILYLSDKEDHKKILLDILKYKSPLHWSFSERLLRFNFLSPLAVELAVSELLKEENVA